MQLHVLIPIQVPPLAQLLMQSANVYKVMHCQGFAVQYLLAVQDWPDHPGEQLHVLGAKHVPPLAQSGLQIAIYIYFMIWLYTGNTYAYE